MTSFQISVSPTRRAAARFISAARKALLSALAEERENGMTQSELARRIGVNRSVISRQLTGTEDMTLGRVGEIASAMGRRATLTLPRVDQPSQVELRFNVSAASTTAFVFILPAKSFVS